MAQMSGGEAIVRSLISEGVEVIFGIPSAHNVPIYDALYGHPEIRHITTRHEQGAGYMADGYARASGKPGVFITSTGPGACNSVTAMAEAYAASSPVINITTQISSRQIGKFKGIIHECKDQLGMFQAVTGWNKRAESIKEIPSTIHEAFARVRNQRPRPIELEFPMDFLQSTEDVEVGGPVNTTRAAGNTARVAKAAGLLSGSRKPVIWAGGGVIASGAHAELVRLAELLQAPVLTTLMGKTVMPWDHPLYLGRLGVAWGGGPGTGKSPVARLLGESDVILAIGTKLGSPDTLAWGLPLPDQLIYIDIDDTQFGRNYPYKLGIAGDARAVLEQLLQALGESGPRPSRAAEVAAIKREVYERAAERAPEEMKVVEDIRATAGPDAILTFDITAAAYWIGRFSKTYQPRTELGPWWAGLGFGFPSAIGAKVARPDRPVVAVVGDGGFMFTAQELATAMQFGANMVVIIFDDSCFGAIKGKQRMWFGGRYIGVTLRNPDFVKFAESFGATATRVSGLPELKPALEKALSSGTTNIIVVPHALIALSEDMGTPSPMLPGSK